MNFFVGSSLAKSRGERGRKDFAFLKAFSSKQLLFLGIFFNIALLGYFKYTDFLLTNVHAIFGSNVHLLRIALPLGISFFTFTQIAFLVDAYKGKVKEYDLLNYTLFVSYFPHLLAGPILHHSEMMPQFASRWNWAVRWRNISVGLVLFTIGLFKKVVVADTFAQWANAGFDSATSLNLFAAWATSLSYTMQLYFDFSGYTDMAIGISRMYNITLPINFNSPYKAKNIQDFWRRWHITLSRFLKDYIYIPIGGNKVTNLRNYLNLLSVFLIGGLWHGAAWTFVAWGALHGMAIVVHRAWRDSGLRMWGWLGWLITFNFVNIAWVFFRAKDFEAVGKVLGGMCGVGGVVISNKLAGKLAFLEGFGITFGNWLGQIGGNDWAPICLMLSLLALSAHNSNEIVRDLKHNWKWALFSASLFYMSLNMMAKMPSQFIYFNF